jgi:hypothetical protein
MVEYSNALAHWELAPRSAKAKKPTPLVALGGFCASRHWAAGATPAHYILARVDSINRFGPRFKT